MTNNQTLILYLGTILLCSSLCFVMSHTPIYAHSKSINFKLGFINKNVTYNNRWMIVIALLPMICLAGFRYYTGADYQQYVWSFNRTADSDLFFSSYFYTEEPLYQLSKYFVYILFGNDPTYWFFILAALTIINIIFALNIFDNHFDYSWFTLLFGLFTYLHMFNYVRQLFAASIILIGIAYYIKGKKVSFFLAILLATFSHRSSIVFLIFPVIYYFRNKISSYFFKLLMIVSPLFVALLGRILGYFPFFSRYVQYFLRGYTFGFGWLIDVIPIIVILLISEYYYMPSPNTMSLIHFSWFIIPLRVISYYSYAAGRLFLNMSLIAFTTYAISRFKSSRKRIYIDYFVFVLFIAYFIYEFYIGNNSDVFPYQSIWSK